LDIDPGTVVANRYRITRPLGRGGMGEVFAAENIRTGRPVAVKLLRSDSKTKETAMQRFRQEARAAGSINSDHVTQVLDVEDDHEHGVVLVFELLEGESLIDRLKRTGPIPFEELYPIIEQVWMGLADAHRAGIIHRDLKPSNVFLERRPDGTTRVKILDFGISKLPKEMGGETLTEMGQSLGTFSFMPPEQIGKAKTVDHRADIYACATMIYQSLTGQLPYSARNILVMVEMKSKTDARRLAEAMGGPVDPRLETFIAQGLERDPSKRFQTALDALNAWRELRPPQRGVEPSSPPPPQQPLSSAHGPFAPDEAEADRPPLRLARMVVSPQRPPMQETRGVTPPRRPLSSMDVNRGPSFGGPGPTGAPLGVLPPGMSPPRRPNLPSSYHPSAPPAETAPVRSGPVMEVSTDSAATLAMPSRHPGVGGSPLGVGGTQPVRMTRPLSPISPSARATTGRKPSSSRPPLSPAAPNALSSDNLRLERDVSHPNEQNSFEEPKGSPLPSHPASYYVRPPGSAPSAPPMGQQAGAHIIDDPSSTPGNSAEFATQIYRPRTDPERLQTRNGSPAHTSPKSKSSSMWAFLVGALAFLLVGFCVVAVIMRYMATLP
jgi:serine/threonine protein kinase